MMKRISYLTICLSVLLVFIPSKSQPIDNSAVIADQSGAPGDADVLVAVSLSNDVRVTRFRFEITFDGSILAATSVELAPRAKGLVLSGVVGTDEWLYLEAVAPSGKSLPNGSGPIVNIFFNVDSSAQPGTQTSIGFLPGNCMVLDTLGMPLPSLSFVDGLFTVVSVGIDDGWIPQTGDLTERIRSYPNPFRNSTTIQYVLPDLNGEDRISLQIFDQMGRCVVVLTEYTIEGNHCLFQWNGTDVNGDELSSGVYFCQLCSFNIREVFYTEGNRLVLLR